MTTAKCDIIIPVWNQLEYTKACLDSIAKNTSVPYRVIIVDNASTDDTVKYIDDLRHTDAQISLIRNLKNEGFIKAVNKGIRAATAEYVCLLNNDTIVTDGWLGEMIGVLSRGNLIALVNPSSNSLGQKPPKGMAPEAYAKTFSQEKGRYVELGSALGFCLLARKRLFDDLGYFDEIFGFGNYEDTDFSYRAKRKGYKVVRAQAAYVYHKENRSFNFLKNFKKDFEKNRAIFEKRWGRPKRLFFICSGRTALNPSTLNFVQGELAKNNWVYFAGENKNEIYIDHSRFVKYKYNGIYVFQVVWKMLFKRKKFDIIYVNDKNMAALAGILKPFHKAAVSFLKF